MKLSLKKAATAAAIAGALALPASVASAQPPVVTGGLVNVTVTDVLSGNTVSAQVPITVAANVCGVDVAVLAQDLADGNTDCSTDQEIITLSTQRGNSRR